jgi:hypothetical protein
MLKTLKVAATRGVAASTLAIRSCRRLAACAGLIVLGLMPFVVSAQTLTHRYSFFSEPNGSTVATDLVASANGTLQGAAAITGAQLVLNGASGTYLNLPGGLITGDSAVTVEAWADFGNLPVNCYLFSFGNTDGGGAGENYIFCAPQAARITISGVDPGYNGEQNAASGGWSGMTNLHVVAIYNPPAHYLAVYTNGVLAGVTNGAITTLASVNNVLSYVGRSLYTSDPYAPINVDEFRIYNGALSAQQVALDAASGPSLIVSDPGALLSVQLQMTNRMLAGATQTAVVLGNFANVTNVNLFTYGQPTVISDNTNVFTVSAAGLVTTVAPGAANFIATYGGLSATQNVAVTGFSTNQFVFDTFGDGFWTIVNQGNSNVFVSGSSGSTQETYTNGALEQQFEVLYNLQNGTFRLRQRSSWLCIGPLLNFARPGVAVTTASAYSGISAQQWYLVNAGGGYYRIFNAASNVVLQTDNGTPASVTLAVPSASPFQLWQFNYQTHYPKKGTGGWVGQFGTSWAYDWGYNSFSPSSLAASNVYEPMQWGNWNVDTSTYSAWHSTPKPVYLMGFNEPDNSTQANMTTNQAIALWPQLQAMNVPLVSPAMQNTYAAWIYNFFSLITNNSYRVDYTAVHQYNQPNATALINNLHTVYTTWGRPVWLTEFSPVDWAGNQGWTEDDNFNFLAEFMWMAEDQTWLKRYAIFLFSGSNPLPPWQSTTAGYRGNFFAADGVTLTPYGELYATWDANRSLLTRTPCFLHNLGTSFRLTTTNSTSGVAASSILVRDPTTQWALLAAPTTNHWYIVSLKDGRRLNDGIGGTLALSPVGTTGRSLEWIFTGPDSQGYYYVTNAFWGQALNGSGTAPAITFGMVGGTTQNSYTRWRQIKPYQPVPIATATAPVSLSATAGSQSVALSWTTNANRFFNLYRSTVSGGPYTRLASVLTNGTYADNNVSNGVLYFYVATGLNILGEESGYSSEVSARPVSLVPPSLNFSFANNLIQFNWATDHTGWRLMMNTNDLADPNAWFPVPNSANTNQIGLPIDTTQAEVFFRLIYP